MEAETKTGGGYYRIGGGANQEELDELNEAIKELEESMQE